MRVRPLILLVAVACGAPPVPRDGGDAGTSIQPRFDAGATDAGSSGVAGIDAGAAPRSWPRVPSLTHDLDTDASHVLEPEVLRGACDAVKAGATDRLTRLRCGKWMFFYETFGTIGIPTVLLEFNQKFYGDFFQPGFASMGWVPDPASAKGMPLGLQPSTGKLGTVATSAFTCAACHFGKLPDGRYAVGYANSQLDYGKFIATLGAGLSLGLNANDPKIHPMIRSMMGPAVTTAKAKPGYLTESALTGLTLLGAGNVASNTLDDQERMLNLRSGTMDFLTKPLLEDGVWTVSRIISLWNLPTAEQRSLAGMPHEMLSWNGAVRSLDDFVAGFVVIGAGAAEWTPARLAPLNEYVLSLRAPPSLAVQSAALIEEGAQLFVRQGCSSCHAGPSGEGPRVFSFTDIETDAQYANIYNPDANGVPCCGFGDASTVSRGVKAPRMAGLFSQTRLLHNGSVGSLDELFCRLPRSSDTSLGQRSTGHQQTCTSLTDGEKSALIEYLRSL